MNVNQLCDLVARKTGIGFTDVQLYARRLREGGYLPQGGRGQKAPEITVEHAATLIMAMLATDTARQAPDLVKPTQRIRDKLATLLSDPDECAKISSFKFYRTGELAVIQWMAAPDGITGDLDPDDNPEGRHIYRTRGRQDSYEEPVSGGGTWSSIAETAIEVSAEIQGRPLWNIAAALAAEGVT